MTIGHGFVPVLVGARGNRHALHLVLNSGVALDVVVAAVGHDAFSGQTCGAAPRGVIIPLRSVAWIDAPRLAVPEIALGSRTRPSLRDFLENSRRLSHFVTVRTPGGVVSGVCGEVSAEAVSVVDATGHRRLVATASIELIFVGA